MKSLTVASLAFLSLVSCLPVYQTRQIAAIHAVGVTGGQPAGDAAYRTIESTLDGVSAIFRRRGFTTPLETFARSRGKRYEIAYYLTGERLYSDSYLYSKAQEGNGQCTLEIDRKTAVLRFSEAEWPRKSGIFPMSERQRQYMRDTARIVADYLRQNLPSHYVEVSFDEHAKA
jgi:hypothetical protein